MSTTFYGYQERNGEDQVNWESIASDFTKSLTNKINQREKDKKEIDDANKAMMSKLQNAPVGDNELSNRFVLNHSDNAQKVLLMANRLLKKGSMSPKDFLTLRQNIEDGTKSIFALGKEYESIHKKKMERYKTNKSSKREIYEMERYEGMAKLKGVETTIDPATGNTVLVRKVTGKDGKVSYQDVTSFSQLRQGINTEFNRFDVTKSVSEITDTLGEKMTTKIREATQELGLDQIIKTTDAKDLKGYEVWEENIINSMLVNDDDLSSVLTDYIGGYEFTSDKKEWESDTSGKLIYVDRTESSTGDLKFKDEQKKAAREALQTAIRVTIDEKIEKSAMRRPQKKPASTKPSAAEVKLLNQQNAAKYPSIRKQDIKDGLVGDYSTNRKELATQLDNKLKSTVGSFLTVKANGDDLVLLMGGTESGIIHSGDISQDDIPAIVDNLVNFAYKADETFSARNIEEKSVYVQGKQKKRLPGQN